MFVYDVSNFYALLARFDVEADHEVFIRALCFSSSGRYLYAGSEDGCVRMYSVAKMSCRHIFYGHVGDVTSLDAPRECAIDVIVSGSSDGTVRIWDILSGKNRRVISLRESADEQTGVYALAFGVPATGAASTWVAVGCSATLIRLFSISTGLELDRCEAHSQAVFALALAPNGEYLASTSLDASVRLWGIDSASASVAAAATTPSADIAILVPLAVFLHHQNKKDFVQHEK